MVQSNALTVDDYLSELDDGRREAVAAVRAVILDDLPLDLVAEVVARTPIDEFVNIYQASRSGRR